MDSSYLIYNASAGAGKTYTLVKTFLKIMLSYKGGEKENADYQSVIKSLLAITFTNKAVNEMKKRIIEQLMLFSEGSEKSKNDGMFLSLKEELAIDENKLIQRAKNLLNTILHNYAVLTITTIDGFNHKLIRLFAFDLELNPNFEVFMDTDLLLKQAVNNLLQKIGEDESLRNLLIEFSKEKIKEDKNWDTTQEILDVAKLLTIENNYEYLQIFENKELTDFENLKIKLKENLKEINKKIEQNVNLFFNFINNNDIASDNFSGKYVYKFFEKLKNGDRNVRANFDSKWAVEIDNEEKSLYPQKLKKENPSKAQLLDDNQALIAQWFREIENNYFQEKKVKNILKNLTPLAVLSSIQKEIKNIKEEENILPISDFNSIINQKIIGQPSPFIYEKIGQRYQHYFIDEFQDTSFLQWRNIRPLVKDALQSENHSGERGSLLLVGDAKQSIYRWRGGKAEQFMDLYLKNEKLGAGEEPIHIEPTIEDLEANYRSYSEIINFNNKFFDFIVKNTNIFDKNSKYNNLYQKAQQKLTSITKKGGFVSIELLDKESQEVDNQENNEELSMLDLYCSAVINSVEDVLQNGFSQQDICILTRTNLQGCALAQALTEAGYKVISPDALLLNNVIEVKFLINLIKLALNKNNEEAKLEILILYAQIKKIEDIHSFLTKFVNEPITKFYEDNNFSLHYFYSVSFYESIAYAINVFALNKTSDAYLSHFMNVIFDFKGSKKGGMYDFLTFWEEKKDKLSISAPDGVDAIKIMTVHKSKGLEFPVVIYTFVKDKLIKNKDKIWLPVSEEFDNFEYLLIDNYKDLEKVNKDIVLEETEKQILDQINILYVAMTRPKAYLYIIGEKQKKIDTDNIKNFSEILQLFLENNNDYIEREENIYEFGQRFQIKKENTPEEHFIEFKQNTSKRASYTIVTRSGMLWDTQKQSSIEKGNIIHELLSKIYLKNDVQNILETAYKEGIINEKQYPIIENQIQNIVNHKVLGEYFTENYIVLNEREFINERGEYERPDRIVKNKENNNVIIIDYKTGSYHSKYTQQIENYKSTLSKMNWNVENAYLVFINEDIEIISN
ncbi:MAG: UvrD-helicase domain-containing protein [Capnocytophaga sp.]|nr:UvrD-helicase domain-containing protein [Capnocytophaga sp.]